MAAKVVGRFVKRRLRVLSLGTPVLAVAGGRRSLLAPHSAAAAMTGRGASGPPLGVASGLSTHTPGGESVPRRDDAAPVPSWPQKTGAA